MKDPLPDPLKSYVCVAADIPEDLDIFAIPESELPVGWRASDPPPVILAEIGTRWLESLSTAVARVPSAMTPGEFNYLLNPLHTEFFRIMQSRPQPFRFDARMWKR